MAKKFHLDLVIMLEDQATCLQLAEFNALGVACRLHRAAGKASSHKA